jgi:hypothetical protein
MPHERMSVMLWTLGVLSALMGILLVLAAAQKRPVVSGAAAVPRP